MHDDGDLLAHWLDAGLGWLARLQAVGLACAGQALLDEGRAWCARGELLGWPAVVRLGDVVLDPSRPPAIRARALLDLSAWLATAQRLGEAQRLIGAAGAD